MYYFVEKKKKQRAAHRPQNFSQSIVTNQNSKIQPCAHTPLRFEKISDRIQILISSELTEISSTFSTCGSCDRRSLVAFDFVLKFSVWFLLWNHWTSEFKKPKKKMLWNTNCFFQQNQSWWKWILMRCNTHVNGIHGHFFVSVYVTWNL